MDLMMRDFRYALRLLVRNPGFAALALTTLALGIGVSTAMFTVLDQVVLRPLPYGTPEELVFINETSVDGTQTYSVSIPNFFDWRERNRTFVSMSALRAANFNLTSDEGPERIRGAMVSGDFFGDYKDYLTRPRSRDILGLCRSLGSGMPFGLGCCCGYDRSGNYSAFQATSKMVSLGPRFLIRSDVR